MWFIVLLSLLGATAVPKGKEECTLVCAGSSDELRSKKQVDKAKKEGRCVRVCVPKEKQ